MQPDSIVPNPYNPQSLNRYSYLLNNPLRYTDPTGHEGWDVRNAINEFAFGFVSEIVVNQFWFMPQAREALAANSTEPVLGTGGRVVGDVAAGVLSVLEGGLGAGGMGGGAISCGTGVLCIVGAPAVAVGVALEGQAVASGLSAAANFGTNISMAAKKAAGDSGITNRRPEQSRGEMEKSIRSLKKRIAEHQQKIENREGFDPPTGDPIINQHAAESRIEHLQQEIDNFQNQIDQLQKMLDDLDDLVE